MPLLLRRRDHFVVVIVSVSITISNHEATICITSLGFHAVVVVVVVIVVVVVVVIVKTTDRRG